MKPSASDKNLLDGLNAVALKEEELFRVINDAVWTHEIGMCSIMTGWIATKRLCQDAPDKAKAILTRLQALSAMMENDELKNWLLVDGASVMPTIAHKALVSAAAEHPLSIIDGDIAFEKESFLHRILELAVPEGSDNN